MMHAPSVKDLEKFLSFARGLAIEGGRITLDYFRKSFEVEQKADTTPVTIADKQTEEFLREQIRKRFPDHGILGEEFGEENPGATWRWILDPIDGTKSFIHGIPLYAVLLGLEFEGDSHLGVIHCPPMDETVCAATGLGCTYNGENCHVSETKELSKAWLHSSCFTNVMLKRPQFCSKLITSVGHTRTWADAYGYMLVAIGRADIMFDEGMNVWDAAALKPIILEAGGGFTDLEGISTIHGSSALATNGHLHDAVLALVKEDAL